MKKQIGSIFSVAIILAMVLSFFQVSKSMAMKPEPYRLEKWGEFNPIFVCEEFGILETYHYVEEGYTHFDNDGRRLRDWVRIRYESVLTKIGGDPNVKLFTTASYSGSDLYDETGKWYASEGSGVSWKISTTEPGYGVLLIDSGHAAVIWDTNDWLHLTPNWFTSPDEVEAVCAWFASQ
jgi:hypothetical protein